MRFSKKIQLSLIACLTFACAPDGSISSDFQRQPTRSVESSPSSSKGRAPSTPDDGTSSGTDNTSDDSSNPSPTGPDSPSDVGSRETPDDTSVPGTGGGDETGTQSSFADIVSKSLFEQMFPRRNQFYTYEGLVAATAKFTSFTGSGSDDDRKREAAAFLANVARETGELVYIEEIARGEYCEARSDCPCANGEQYFGRGPIQISWNYNYCAAGKALGHDLRADPGLVAQNAEIAWGTCLWFWMTQSGAGTQTPHNAILRSGFGETIQSINGAIECDGGAPDAVRVRVDFYEKYCGLLGVDPGTNVSC